MDRCKHFPTFSSVSPEILNFIILNLIIEALYFELPFNLREWHWYLGSELDYLAILLRRLF